MKDWEEVPLFELDDGRKPWQRSVLEDREGKVRADHPDTSRKAARRLRSGTARAKVYDLLRAHEEGLTDAQIQRKLKMNPSTERPRRIELVEDGYVRDSGHRREGMIVWEVARR